MTSSSVAHEIPEKEPSGYRAVMIWKYTWTVLRNAFYLWLIYVAFSKVVSTFETLMLGLLVVIYQAVSETLKTVLRTTIEEGHAQRGLLLGLYRHFKDPETEEGERQLRELVQTYHKGDGLWLLNGLTFTLAYFYVLWKIVAALAFA